MKFELHITRDKTFAKAEHVYTFPEFPTIKDLLSLNDPLIAQVKLKGFNENFLAPAKKLMEKVSNNFTSTERYVHLCADEDLLLHDLDKPVYIAIFLRN